MTWKEAEFEAEISGTPSEDERNLLTCEQGKWKIDPGLPVSASGGSPPAAAWKKRTPALLGREYGLRSGTTAAERLQAQIRPLARLLLPQQQASAGEAESPRARFGDPRWNYLDLRIVRCTNIPSPWKILSATLAYPSEARREPAPPYPHRRRVRTYTASVNLWFWCPRILTGQIALGPPGRRKTTAWQVGPCSNRSCRVFPCGAAVPEAR